MEITAFYILIVYVLITTVWEKMLVPFFRDIAMDMVFNCNVKILESVKRGETSVNSRQYAALQFTFNNFIKRTPSIGVYSFVSYLVKKNKAEIIKEIDDDKNSLSNVIKNIKNKDEAKLYQEAYEVLNLAVGILLVSSGFFIFCFFVFIMMTVLFAKAIRVLKHLRIPKVRTKTPMDLVIKPMLFFAAKKNIDMIDYEYTVSEMKNSRFVH